MDITIIMTTLSTILYTIFVVLISVIVVICLNVVSFGLNQALTPKLRPDDEPDAISDVPNETKSPLNLPHARFNPTLSTKPVPLPHDTDSDIHRSKEITTLIAVKSIFTKVPVYDFNDFKYDNLFFYASQSIYRVSQNSNNLIETVLIEAGTPLNLKQEQQNVLWLNIHNAILKSVVDAVKDAIKNEASMIEIIYEYDGVWAYAAGYWPTSDYTEAHAYVEQLGELSQKIDINFVKLTRTNQHRYQDLIDKINNNKESYYA